MKFLVDTNVVPELRKGRRADRNVLQWFESLSSDQLFLSALTIGEIWKGIESIRRRDRRTAEHLESWLAELIRSHADRILPIDLAVAEEWGKISAPAPLPVLDVLVAATARVHGLVVATRNIKDLRRARVRCVNPFESPSTEGDSPFVAS